MGSKGGTSTASVQIPPEVLARYNSVNATAEKAASTPFQSYSSDPAAFVAPLNSTQQAGIANTNSAAGQAQPFYQAATNTLADASNAYQPYNAAATTSALGAYGGAQPYQGAATALAADSTAPITQQSMDVGSYLNPYLQNVLGSTSALLNQNNQQQQSGQLGSAIKSGAFGGDRSGIAAANLAQQQNLANASIYSGIASQGYNTALGAAQTQANANRSALLSGATALAGIGQQGYTQGMGLSQQLQGLGKSQYDVGANTATTLAGLGAGAQSAGLQGAQAQLGAGQAQQQTDQAGKTALYNQFLQQQSYPFQTAQFLANIAEGTGSLSGNTTTTNTVQNGIFSDRRLKHDIKPIGKTFDGQTIYSYRYNGEKRTEMGLIAQEVEKKHPGAVGLAGGFKTVNYEHATKGAADKGHFAAGGLVAANDDREHFYGGGMAAGLGGGGYDPAALSQMYANYQAMYGPLLSHGAGGPGATGGIVPASTVPVGQLHPAQAPQQSQQTLASTVNQDAKAGLAAYDLYSKIKGGGGEGQSGDKLDVASAKAEDSGLYDDPLTKWAGARGGLAGYASGGVIPYDEAGGLNIPDDVQHYEMMKPADGKPVDSGGGGLASTIGSIAKLASFIPGISDKRLKTDLRPVGKTFDGQTVYSYKFKGDDTPRMGLIAQEVEKKHPHAVGHVKTVDYAKATAGAAKRGKFASGGSPIYAGIKAATSPYGKFGNLAGVLADDAAKPLPITVGGDDSAAPADAPAAPPAAPPAEHKDDTPAVAAPTLALPENAKVENPQPTGSIKSIVSQTAPLIAKAEGTARNPKSSAIGPYQFLNGTFRQYAAKVDPTLAKTIAGMSNADLTAYRAAHPELASVQKQMGERFTADNAAALSAANLPVTPASLYLAHVVGAGGAKKVLAADPSTPLSELLPKATIANNPLGATAGAALGWAGSRIAKMGRAARASGGRMGYADGGSPFEDAFADVVDPEDPKKKAIDAALAAAAPRAIIDGPAPDVTPPADPTAFAKPAADVPAGLAAATAPTDLVPTAQRAPAPVPQQPTYASTQSPNPGFFKGIGRGDARSIIPLLSGIGALATTPTNNVFTALAAGLGAGAQAAQGQREFGLSQQHVGNETLTAQTGAMRGRAEVVNKLLDAKKAAIGNQAAMADLYKTVYNLKAAGQINDADVARITSVDSTPSFADITGGAPYGGGLGTTAPATPMAPAVGGLAPPPAASAAPPSAPAPLGGVFTGLDNVKPVSVPEPTGILPSTYDTLNSTGAGYYKQFYHDPSNADWQAYSTATQRADSFAKLLQNPAYANTEVGQRVAQIVIPQLRSEAATHKAAADAQAQAIAAPRVAELTQAVQHAADYTTPGGVYDRIGNTTKSITDALSQHNIQVDSPLYAATVGKLATAFPGLVPDSLKGSQGAAEIAEQNKTLLNIFGVKGTGAAARSEATELAALNRTHGQGPAAVYDFSVKAKALADRQAQFSQALTENQNTLAVPVSQFQQQWLKAHPLDKYLTDVVQHTPLAKGMTPAQAAQYIPPATSKAEMDAQIAKGARYINVNGHRIVEVQRHPHAYPSLVEWTGQ